MTLATTLLNEHPFKNTNGSVFKNLIQNMINEGVELSAPHGDMLSLQLEHLPHSSKKEAIASATMVATWINTCR